MKLLRSYFLFLPAAVMLLLSFSSTQTVHADVSDITVSATTASSNSYTLTGNITSPAAGATYTWQWQVGGQNVTTDPNSPSVTVNITPGSTTTNALARATSSIDMHSSPTVNLTFTYDINGNLTNVATSSSGSGSPAGTPGSSTSVTCGTDQTICNPVNNASGAQVTNLQDLLVVLIQYMLGLIGVVAVLMIIWGGYQLVISAGNEEGFKKAKQTLMYAIGGLLLAVLSYSIVSIIENAIRNQK